MQRMYVLIWFLLAASFSVVAQIVEYYDADWNLCIEDDASFYREISYGENENSEIKVRDYFITGELQFEGQLCSINPDTLDGKCIWYHWNGQKSEEAYFEKGEIVGDSREWSESGKEEGVMDESGCFFSFEYLMKAIDEMNIVLEEKLRIDSSSILFLLKTGASYQQKGNFKSSLSFFQLAYDLSILIENKIVLAYACNNIGSTYHSRGQLEEALQYYNIAKQILEHLNLNVELATSYNNIGELYHSQGKFKQALKWHHKAIEIKEKLNLEAELAVSYNNIGAVHHSKGQLEEALQYYYKAKEIKERFNIEAELAISNNNIGIIYTLQGRFKHALTLFHKAKEIQERLGLEVEFAISYNNIGAVYRTQGKLEEALKWHYKAKKIIKQLGLEFELASSYSHISAVYHSQGKLEEALILYNKAKEIREKLGLEAELAISYNNIGAIYNSQEKLEKALIWHNKAVEIQERLGIQVELAISYSNIAGVYNSQGKTEQALKWNHKAIEIRKRLGLEIDLASSYGNIGSVYNSQGKLENAIFLFKKAIEIQQRLGLEAELAASYNNIGGAYNSQGKSKQALKWYYKAIKIQERLGLEADLSSSFNRIGIAFKSQGKLDQALVWYHKARRIEEKLGLTAKTANSYNNIGNIYDAQEQLSVALKWYHKAKDIYIQFGLETKQVASYNNIGSIHLSQREFDKALLWFNKAKEINEHLHLNVGLALSYNNLGITYLSMGKLDQALMWFKKDKDILESLNLQVELSTCYNNIGNISYSQRNYFNAIKWFKKAKKIQEKLNLNIGLSLSYKNLSSSFYCITQLDSALHYAQKNVYNNENLRNQNQGQFSRQSYINKNLNSVEIGISSAFQLKHSEVAFFLSEKRKARSLIDLLNEASNDFLNIPLEQKELYELMQNQFSSINQNLNIDISDVKRSNLVELRDSIFFEMQVLKDQIKTIVPEYANLFYSETTNKNQVQNILKKNEAIVSFFTGQANTFAFIITPTQLEMVNLGNSSNLSHLINTFQNNFIKRQKTALSKKDIILNSKLKNTFFKHSTQLYQKLWAPLEKTGLLKNKKIILIPDGPLHYLPFELLIKDKEQKNYSDYHYLLKEYPINYYPSATVLHFERTKAPKKEKAQKDFFGLAVENFENNHCYESKTTFQNLSYSKQEINAISDLFPINMQYTLTDQKATKKHIKTIDLSQYRYLHFSTHGVINTEKPDFSRILLRPSDTDDGCLNLYEIFELDLNADLVTLSACETGLGKLVRGEGMVGFTRALMYAGTPSMILSLWEVVDESTSDLFVDYYSKLQKNKGKDKYNPLREVQLEMIKSGKYSNPYYWAPFVFIGERE